ncbi:hypothetical protein MPL3356_70140 [Mesorhizobium plurifarium]|uniref:Uncharacterized protein n=1 Tax=Mesorhizobium plurifarium TaxID=69974 RepID=A0A090G9L6_MESPL|nr:hypothetical protein MPL3356_70140 [Mesorhizobium plurifarium]
MGAGNQRLFLLTRGEGKDRARPSLPLIAFSDSNRLPNFRQIARRAKTSTRNFVAISAS